MNTETRDEVVQIHLDDIIPNRFQPREVFDERALKELAVSIREHGVIQPIIVRNVNGKYEIIAGERRYKASALAGLTKIPAIIRDLDDKESSKVALLENLQRKNLNPIEEARTYQKILEIDEMTQEELAKTMGKSQSAVANKIRLLSLPEDIQEALLKERISERHARALLNVSDAKIQKQLLDKIESTKMSVRALEEEIRTMYPKGKDASDIPIEATAIASASGFLDNKPLVPTVSEIEEETSNYGKVVIAPPTENEKKEEETITNKFINYGEEENNNSTLSLNDMNIQNAGTQANTMQTNPLNTMNQVVENRNPEPMMNNMMGMNMPIGGNEPPQKEAFDLSELPSIKMPGANQEIISDRKEAIPDITPGNPLPTIVTTQGNYTVDQAMQKLRDLIEDLKLHGVSVNADEMNFPKSYQVIIKIDKPEE